MNDVVQKLTDGDDSKKENWKASKTKRPMTDGSAFFECRNRPFGILTIDSRLCVKALLI